MTHTEQDDRFMRISQVAKYCTVTTQTIRNWIKEKTFPKGNKISEKVTLWRKSEIDSFFDGAELNEVAK
jgi:predicted DNA-binding transcriptional regulator AlpA